MPNLKPFKFVKWSLIVIMGFSISACNNAKNESNNVYSDINTISEVYEVHEDGRIYAFYDHDLYKEFLAVGETPFRLTRIAAGPNGETMVFGLTRQDKKKGANTPALKLYENTVQPADDFYAETVRHGRIYVFDRFSDMQPVRQFGHPNFFYMEVGAGPNGKTVVFVLNKNNKKTKPNALISEYKRRNNL